MTYKQKAQLSLTFSACVFFSFILFDEQLGQIIRFAHTYSGKMLVGDIVRAIPLVIFIISFLHFSYNLTKHQEEKTHHTRI